MTETRSNAELARAYVDDAMTTGTFIGPLTHAHGRDAVLNAANVLAVLATADAMRPAPASTTVVNMGSAPMSERGRILLQRQIDRAHDQLPEHEVRVGDPDPTPPGGWAGIPGNERCPSPSPTRPGHCHARRGHLGQHIQGNDSVVTAVWS